MSFKKGQSGGPPKGPVTRSTRHKQALSKKAFGGDETSELIKFDDAFKNKHKLPQAGCRLNCECDRRYLGTSVKCYNGRLHSEFCLTTHEKFESLQANYSYSGHDEYLDNKPNGNICYIKSNSSHNNENIDILSLENKMNTTKKSTIISNNFANIFLTVNYFFMLIYCNLMKHSDHKKHFEIYGTTQLFSSLEQGLAMKILWCIIFGIITDILSWKTAFRIQAALWIIYLVTKICVVNFFITWLLSAICFSSSALLISLVGICKICELSQSWSSFYNLYFLSSSVLVCTQFTANHFESFRRMAMNYIEPFAPETDIFHEAFSVVTKFLPFVLICGCAVSLVIIPLLSPDRVIPSTTSERNNNGDDKDLPNTNKLRCLLKILTLEITIFLPPSCYLVSLQSDVAREQPLRLPICLILWSVLAISQRFICLRRLFVSLTSLLFLSFILLYVHRYTECLLLSIVIPSLSLIILPLFNYNVLEELKRQKMDEELTGLTFACLLSVHLMIRYVSRLLFL